MRSQCGKVFLSISVSRNVLQQNEMEKTIYLPTELTRDQMIKLITDKHRLDDMVQQ